MKEITSELLQKFRAPAFPGSFFISFEGIEGAGKSTQIVAVKEFLEAKNFRVLILREPGGTSFGEKLRQAILNSQTEIHPLAEAYLFASSRAQLLTEVVLKELAVPNTVIIADRYIDSSLVYQGHARGLGLYEILKIHETFPLSLVPHLSIYLKISPETSNARQKIRNAPKDYFEEKGLAFYRQLSVGYDLVTQLFPIRIKTVYAEAKIETVTNDVLMLVKHLINSKL